MKIALLLSGNMRAYYLVYQDMLDRIIRPNNCDVFIYTTRKNYNIITDKTGIPGYDAFHNEISNEELEEIKTLYQGHLKVIQFSEDDPSYPQEKQVTIKAIRERFAKNAPPFNKIIDTWGWCTDRAEVHPHFENAVIDQFFRRSKANDLRKRYEQENNVKYDVIISTRPDLLITGNILKLEDIKMDNLYVEVKWKGWCRNHGQGCNCDNKLGWCQEQIAFGSTNVMERYLTDFIGTMGIYGPKDVLRPECIHYNFVYKAGFKIDSSKFRVDYYTSRLNIYNIRYPKRLTRLLHCFITNVKETRLREQYNKSLLIPSDVNEHIPILYNLVQSCESIVELGLRHLVTTWALLYGLNHNAKLKKDYLGIEHELVEASKMELIKSIADENNIKVNFLEKIPDVLSNKFDMIFIDSLHTYCFMKHTLTKISPFIKKYIVVHDTNDNWANHDWGYHHNVLYFDDKSKYSIKVDKSKRGISQAITDFLSGHSNEWKIKERIMISFGITILERVTKA